MAKNKVSGPDGVPVEFYLKFWELTGPIELLTILNKVIEEGSLHFRIVRDTIVLLPKTVDQGFLKHKRPLTMLNVAYKIGARAMQLRLSPTLNDFISDHQFAFLPGRSIHHALLLTNESLHAAIRSHLDFFS